MIQSDRVYHHILKQLLRRNIRPGQLLDRRKIAEELEVSLIPVSDAVQRLSYEGFLTARHRQGTFVVSPSVEDVCGQLLLREAIECQCARLYCGGPVKKSQRRLHLLASKADRAADSGRPIWSEDFEFHQALVALTECKALIDCFSRVVKLSMFHQIAIIAPIRKTTYKHHVELLNKLCVASSDEADSAIRQHIRAGKENLIGEFP
ncbi:MAG: GntR family transcriptional regulator [Pirellulaceae bacterium]|nr:GntR family transcriptional regulator [Pirellulaceae bacterium]